jgi:hypothetical protein
MICGTQCFGATAETRSYTEDLRRARELLGACQCGVDQSARLRSRLG